MDTIDSESGATLVPAGSKGKPKRPKKPSKSAKTVGRPKKQGKPTAHRASKKAEVIAMLRRSKGATLAEIMAATKWQAHTVRGFISILGSEARRSSRRRTTGNRPHPQVAGDYAIERRIPGRRGGAVVGHGVGSSGTSWVAASWVALTGRAGLTGRRRPYGASPWPLWR